MTQASKQGSSWNELMKALGGEQNWHGELLKILHEKEPLKRAIKLGDFIDDLLETHQKELLAKVREMFESLKAKANEGYWDDDTYTVALNDVLDQLTTLEKDM